MNYLVRLRQGSSFLSSTIANCAVCNRPINNARSIGAIEFVDLGFVH